MKKVIFMLLVMTSVAHAMDNDDAGTLIASTTAPKAEANKMKAMLPIIVGGSVVAVLHNLVTDVVSKASVRRAQLTVGLLSLGVAFKYPKLSKAAMGVAALTLAAEVEQNPATYGISDALKLAGEKATIALDAFNRLLSSF